MGDRSMQVLQTVSTIDHKAPREANQHLVKSGHTENNVSIWKAGGPHPIQDKTQPHQTQPNHQRQPRQTQPNHQTQTHKATKDQTHTPRGQQIMVNHQQQWQQQQQQTHLQFQKDVLRQQQQYVKQPNGLHKVPYHEMNNVHHKPPKSQPQRKQQLVSSAKADPQQHHSHNHVSKQQHSPAVVSKIKQHSQHSLHTEHMLLQKRLDQQQEEQYKLHCQLQQQLEQQQKLCVQLELRQKALTCNNVHHGQGRQTNIERLSNSTRPVTVPQKQLQVTDNVKTRPPSKGGKRPEELLQNHVQSPRVQKGKEGADRQKVCIPHDYRDHLQHVPANHHQKVESQRDPDYQKQGYESQEQSATTDPYNTDHQAPQGSTSLKPTIYPQLNSNPANEQWHQLHPQQHQLGCSPKHLVGSSRQHGNSDSCDCSSYCSTGIKMGVLDTSVSNLTGKDCLDMELLEDIYWSQLQMTQVRSQ